MNIIYYSPHPHLNLMSPSGFGTHMREMITAFEKEGCEVLPVIMGGEDKPPQETSDANQSTLKKGIKKTIPPKIWRTLKDLNLLRFDRSKATKRLENAIKDFEPDLIYERCYYLQLSGIRMAKKYDIAHVMEINSPYVDQNNDLGKSRSYLENYAREIEKKQVEGTDLPLAVVGPLREYFCGRYEVEAEKFLITHDAFNRDNINLDADNQQRIKEKYKLQGKKIIGFVGSIFEWHGLDKLIKAYDELDFIDTKLLIVGYGEYMVNLVELTKELDREDDIIFTGQVPKEEIFDYINIMDICVAPNAAWYQSPIKIFEYGAMAKPILGPDTAAVREIMEQNKDGILTDSSKKALKKGLRKLLHEPEKSIEMGLRFKEKVFHKYTWKKNAEKVLNALENKGAELKSA